MQHKVPKPIRKGTRAKDYYLTVRSYAGSNTVEVWLNSHDGAAQFCLLYGTMSKERAEKLAKALELRIIREQM